MSVLNKLKKKINIQLLHLNMSLHSWESGKCMLIENCCEDILPYLLQSCEVVQSAECQQMNRLPLH